MPEFTPLPLPLYASTAARMLEGCKTAIDQLKAQAKRVQKMGVITDGPRKGQPAPLPGQFTWEPREAAACILAWEGRIKQIQIATAK